MGKTSELFIELRTKLIHKENENTESYDQKFQDIKRLGKRN
jgi:hypothetical protein